MTAFVVMDDAASAMGSNTVFVRDRYSIFAFVAPVIWLIWHRLWIEAFAALAATIGLTALATFSGFANAAPLLSVLVSIFVAIDGPQLRIWAHERRGFVQITTVEAENETEAELRYFADGADELDRAAVHPETATPVVAVGRPVPAAPGPALGLLDYPGRR